MRVIVCQKWRKTYEELMADGEVADKFGQIREKSRDHLTLYQEGLENLVIYAIADRIFLLHSEGTTQNSKRPPGIFLWIYRFDHLHELVNEIQRICVHHSLEDQNRYSDLSREFYRKNYGIPQVQMFESVG